MTKQRSKRTQANTHAKRWFGKQTRYPHHVLYRMLLADTNPLEELIGKAQGGDTDADAALCFIASRCIDAREAMPDPLRNYIHTILTLRATQQPPRRRGGNPYTQDRRNIFITHILSRLQHDGVCPTRNRAARDNGAEESACSIVAKALARVGVHIDETGVEKVWSKRSRYVRR